MKRADLKIFYDLGCATCQRNFVALADCGTRYRTRGLRLAHTEKDVNCPAIYRLKDKVRDLVKRESAEQRISKVVEKSIVTSVDLSKSRDDLRLENEPLLSQATDWRSALAELEGKEMPETISQAAETIAVPEYIDISDLLDKLNNCEDIVADLRKQLEERVEQIDALNKGLESMVSQKGSLERIEATKEQLKREDDEVLISR
jgi:FtsZ-binding cell division protein ZapB